MVSIGVASCTHRLSFVDRSGQGSVPLNGCWMFSKSLFFDLQPGSSYASNGKAKRISTFFLMGDFLVDSAKHCHGGVLQVFDFSFSIISFLAGVKFQ